MHKFILCIPILFLSVTPSFGKPIEPGVVPMEIGPPAWLTKQMQSQPQVQSENQRKHEELVKQLHALPQGKDTDIYHPIQDGTIGCMMPGSTLGVIAQIRAKGKSRTADWRAVANASERFTLYKLQDSGCIPIRGESDWQVLWSGDLTQYMINIDADAPVRLWFFYGEMRNSQNQVPPAGHVGQLYPRSK